MSSLDEWAEDFAKAIEDYRSTATSKYVSFDVGRVFRYMMSNASEFPGVIAFVNRDEWGAFRMKDLVGKYLKRAGELHKIYPAGKAHEQRTGGCLYVTVASAHRGDK